MNLQPGTSMTIEPRTRNIASALLLFLVVFLVYSQTITFDWVHYDDDAYVLRNPIMGLQPTKAIQRVFSEGYFRSYIPITLLSHELDLRIWGPEPAGHHLVNAFLHSMNAVWVMLLTLVVVRGIRRSDAADHAGAILSDATIEELLVSIFAALLFALHPQRAESVAWISDRKDLLAAAFALPAMIIYLRARFNNRFKLLSWPAACSLLLFTLGAFSKTSTVALSGVLVLLELTVFSRGKGVQGCLKGLLYTVPFLVVSLVVGRLALVAAPALSVDYASDILPPMELRLLPAYSILFYPGKMLVAFPLVPIYVQPGTILNFTAAAGLVVLALVLVVLYKRGRRAVPVAFASYVILIAPTIIGFSAWIAPWADRYSYLPTIPLAVVCASGLPLLVRGTLKGRVLMTPRTVTVFATTLLGVLLVLTVFQCRIWRTALSLWSHQLTYGYHKSGALNAMGIAYLDIAEFQKAKDMFREAIATDPECLEALLNLRIVANQRADSLSLISLYRDVLRRQPTAAQFHQGLGELLGGQGMEDSSVSELRRAVAIDPDLEGALTDLGIWHFQHGRNDSAKAYFQLALEKAPGYATAHYFMGMLEFARHDTSGAIRQLTTAARLGHFPSKQLLHSMGCSW